MGLFSSKCTSNIRLDGKTAVITGCNTGIGKQTASEFFQRGARVIMACRNAEAARAAADQILNRKSTNCGELLITSLDLSNMESVRNCAKKLLETENNINILVNNAGVMMCPYGTTADGFEMHFGTNHLGHYLFTLLLLPTIIKSRPSRIILVSSCLHAYPQIDFTDLNWEKRPYNALDAYKQSKLANILFAKELAKRLTERGFCDINTYSLHPGVIATDLSRHFDTLIPGLTCIYNFLAGIFAKTAAQGAQTTVYCAVDEKCAKETGLYYAECSRKEPATSAKSAENAIRLWKASWEMVELGNYDPFLIDDSGDEPVSTRNHRPPSVTVIE